MHIADLYGMEWAYIPHFYYNFYVYQYSTSFTAAQAIAEKILSGDRQIIPHYIQFLSSGRSDYAIPTLKKLGIDMTRDEPFLITIRKMNEIMDEIEVLRTADMKRSLGGE
jgi:oligoendopeptidase F